MFGPFLIDFGLIFDPFFIVLLLHLRHIAAQLHAFLARWRGRSSAARWIRTGPEGAHACPGSEELLLSALTLSLSLSLQSLSALTLCTHSLHSLSVSSFSV